MADDELFDDGELQSASLDDIHTAHQPPVWDDEVGYASHACHLIESDDIRQLTSMMPIIKAHFPYWFDWRATGGCERNGEARTSGGIGYRYLLHYATRHNAYAIVRLLLQAGSIAMTSNKTALCVVTSAIEADVPSPFISSSTPLSTHGHRLLSLLTRASLGRRLSLPPLPTATPEPKMTTRLQQLVKATTWSSLFESMYQDELKLRTGVASSSSSSSSSSSASEASSPAVVHQTATRYVRHLARRWLATSVGTRMLTHPWEYRGSSSVYGGHNRHRYNDDRVRHESEQIDGDLATYRDDVISYVWYQHSQDQRVAGLVPDLKTDTDTTAATTQSTAAAEKEKNKMDAIRRELAKAQSEQRTKIAALEAKGRSYRQLKAMRLELHRNASHKWSRVVTLVNELLRQQPLSSSSGGGGVTLNSVSLSPVEWFGVVAGLQQPVADEHRSYVHLYHHHQPKSSSTSTPLSDQEDTIAATTQGHTGESQSSTISELVSPKYTEMLYGVWLKEGFMLPVPSQPVSFATELLLHVLTIGHAGLMSPLLPRNGAVQSPFGMVLGEVTCSSLLRNNNNRDDAPDHADADRASLIARMMNRVSQFRLSTALAVATRELCPPQAICGDRSREDTGSVVFYALCGARPSELIVRAALQGPYTGRVIKVGAGGSVSHGRNKNKLLTAWVNGSNERERRSLHYQRRGVSAECQRKLPPVLYALVRSYVGDNTQWFESSSIAAGGNMLHFTSILRSVTADDIANAITCILPDCPPIDIRIRYSRGKQSKAVTRQLPCRIAITPSPPSSASSSVVTSTRSSSNSKAKKPYRGYGMNQAFVWFQSDDIAHRVMDNLWRIADTAIWGDVTGGKYKGRRHATSTPDYIYHEMHRSYGAHGWTSEPRHKYPRNTTDAYHQRLHVVWGVTHTHGRALASVRAYLGLAITEAWFMSAQRIRCGTCDYRRACHRHITADDTQLFGHGEASGTISDIIVSYMPLPDHPAYFSTGVGQRWCDHQRTAHQRARVQRRAALVAEIDAVNAAAAKKQQDAEYDDEHSTSTSMPPATTTTVTAPAAVAAAPVQTSKKKKKNAKISLDQWNASVQAPSASSSSVSVHPDAPRRGPRARQVDDSFPQSVPVYRTIQVNTDVTNKYAPSRYYPAILPSSAGTESKHHSSAHRRRAMGHPIRGRGIPRDIDDTMLVKIMRARSDRRVALSAYRRNSGKRRYHRSVQRANLYLARNWMSAPNTQARRLQLIIDALIIRRQDLPGNNRPRRRYYDRDDESDEDQRDSKRMKGGADQRGHGHDDDDDDAAAVAAALSRDLKPIPKRDGHDPNLVVVNHATRGGRGGSSTSSSNSHAPPTRGRGGRGGDQYPTASSSMRGGRGGRGNGGEQRGGWTARGRGGDGTARGGRGGFHSRDQVSSSPSASSASSSDNSTRGGHRGGRGRRPDYSSRGGGRGGIGGQ